jgi:hypothetical protein
VEKIIKIVPSADLLKTSKFLKLAERHDANPNGDGAAWWVDTCEVLDLLCNDAPIGAAALSSFEAGGKKVIEIEAAVCIDEACTLPALALLERLCKQAGANRLESQTLRPSLVPMLIQNGWHVAAVRMGKDI